MRQSLISICWVGLMVLICSSVWAGGPSIKPGKWEFTTTITLPMIQHPQTTTHIECFTKEKAQEDPLAALLREGDCQLVSKNVRDNQMDFEVACQGDMNVTSTGKGHFTTQGDTASGEMVVIMNMPEMANMPNLAGQELKMIQSWKGHRIGECN